MIGDRLARLSTELDTELRGNILPWWMEYMPDTEFGGFHGHVTHENRVFEQAGKGAVLNTRILWTFAAAYRMYGQEEYLTMARRAREYIAAHFVDPVYGGVYWELDHRGMPSSPRKQTYAIAFAIYGLAEYHMACGDQEALDSALRFFRDLEQHAFDGDRNGYVEALSREWKPVEDLRLSEKDQNESKTMNTHLHVLEAYTNLLRTWKDPALEQALRNLIGLFLDHFVDPVTHHLNLFFDDDWNLRSTLVSYGHDIECAWLLHEAAGVLGDPGLLTRCSRLAVEMATRNLTGLGSDGGLYYEYFPEEDRTDRDRHWWPQAEAMVGYFNAYQLTGREEFARQTLDSWEFIKGRLVDRKYGEWYHSTDGEGNPQARGEKGGFWKCPYHNSRACMELISRIGETRKKVQYEKSVQGTKGKDQPGT
jgi:mannobiose 2-epimerase